MSSSLALSSRALLLSKGLCDVLELGVDGAACRYLRIRRRNTLFPLPLAYGLARLGECELERIGLTQGMIEQGIAEERPFAFVGAAEGCSVVTRRGHDECIVAGELLTKLPE